ncbi:hypothetical protein [Azospirillum thermophilum]|uniref:DUF3311 domain-containing protein n=1 Tax=Azospirillum thermophilum TaxID=2202148 RepID=A0A2S2CPJ6_9PROT|nr:hypothetical protein [Azospirillum thermophilum]AWK86388.1 hypothetical protein DEW08_09165 [Azospirillum thermophilum]
MTVPPPVPAPPPADPAPPGPPRRSRPLRLDRLVALVLLGLLLFNPPFLRLFGQGGTVLGVPLLHAYSLGAWALVIALAALWLERR